MRPYSSTQGILSDLAVTIGCQFDAEVCSFYQLDPRTQDLILVATVGLKQSTVNTLRIAAGEGLVGLVMESGGPVNLANAQLHSRFKYFPDAEEGPYESFLGVPILDAGNRIGVLVIQSTEAQEFPLDVQERICRVGRSLGAIPTLIESLENSSGESLSWVQFQKILICLIDVLLAIKGQTLETADNKTMKEMLGEAYRITRWLNKVPTPAQP